MLVMVVVMAVTTKVLMLANFDFFYLTCHADDDG
jgi:hypothetical protein